MTNYDVIILGAGAAGLMCAATAARRGRRVLVLEKANKVGKKILMSGGGRCNFTNYSVEPENYIANNPHFCKSALSRYTPWDFIALVERYGIDYEERKHGQLFCRNSAKEILAMLLGECEQAGVDIKTHCEITAVKTLNADAALLTDNAAVYQVDCAVKGLSVSCQSLVVASGALSIPTLGGSGIGYDIARQFALPVTECRAGLVPLMFSDFMKPICERLSGLALEVEVACRGQAFTENLLFTHRGLSGPVILQISNYWQAGDAISIDLLPERDASVWLLAAKQKQGKNRLNTLLNKHLAKALVNELQALWWPKLAASPLAEFSDKHLQAIGEQLNNWCLKPSASEGYRTAEVTLGGVDTHSISSKTLEAKQQPGLYFIGEVLDVSGHLGGFNFQWAWASGYSAGQFV
ncbi:MAG: NAD(P)/FAD-dependent oxidoreductase [Gammaproteobacteria bacterium]|nr:NAD(P)/FAD-dependent oxidoreductase [Gammaproteobacteria bacterium]MBQ0840567.1 NAD(P)/FAD-dependent oxidoreductase [Gammaproteobacteria bacterium]